MNKLLRFMVLMLLLPLLASAQVDVPSSEQQYRVGNYRLQSVQSPKYEYRAVWLTE